MKKYQPMIPTDEKEGYAKTSLKMTRSMSEDIGLKVKKVLEEIDKETVNLSYTEWQWFVSQCWSDEVLIAAMGRAIQKAKNVKLDLNKNKEFLQFVSEKSPSELKNEFRKTHPIARLSLMDLVDKKPPEKQPERKYEDLWMTPEEIRKKYRKKDK